MKRYLLICVALACSISLGFASAQGCCAKEAPKAGVSAKKDAAKKTAGKKAVAKKTAKKSGGCGNCASEGKDEKKAGHVCVCKDPFLSEARKMEQAAAKAEAEAKKNAK